MATPHRTFPGLRRLAALFLLAGTPLLPQIPLKPILEKVGERLLEPKPKLAVTTFTLDGFRVDRVEPAEGATAEQFSGEGLFQLPPPVGPRKLAFKGLVLKGGVAEGSVSEALDGTPEFQGWTYRLAKVTVSTLGSHVEGTATLAGIRLDIAPLAFTPGGLAGTLSPGDLPLAEGDFTATLLKAEVVFGAVPPVLKGAVRVEIALPVRHADTGVAPVLESAPVSFSSLLLVGSGTAAELPVSDYPLLHKGLTWRMDKVAFGFERGTPLLGGQARLQFPLNVFCRAGATGTPYVTGQGACLMHGRTPAPGQRRISPRLGIGFEGFSATFPLPPATLTPSGITDYRFVLDGGTVSTTKGVPNRETTRVSGKVQWGEQWQFETRFKDAPASLGDGLVVLGESMEKPVPVGGYLVHVSTGTVCDFSPSYSPTGMPPEWRGVYLGAYHISLPEPLYRFGSKGERLPLYVIGSMGRFEADGGFTGDLAADIKAEANLYIAPIHLPPFELHFVDGVLVQGPVVTAQMDLKAPPVLPELQIPVTFHLTQNGVDQVELQTTGPAGPVTLATDLIGVDIVVDSARLNPTNFDFTGRFDFHVAGAALPSLAFDHFVLEASGGGIEGDNAPLRLYMAGSSWANLADHPKVNLWGFDFALSESGFGTREDGRFYVGFGGQMDVNPILPSLYNRMLFTTDAGGKGTVEMEKSFDVDQAMSSLGSLKASMGFKVDTAGDQVSDAYFVGTGALKLNLGDAPIGLDAGLRFGRGIQPSGSFPYFYALGHFTMPAGGVPVAPDLEVYGLAGGLAQNFLPDEIRNTENIQGKVDPSLGMAIMAGVDVGTSDAFTVHGGLDLYVSQNLTTVLQGKGWLFCGRDSQPEDQKVTVDIRFTRNPNTFNATLGADLSLYGGLWHSMGTVELHFAPDQQYLHVGTPAAPLKTTYLHGLVGGDGYYTADFQGGKAVFGAGIGVSYDTGDRSFGPLYGRAWFNARGDLIIEVDSAFNPRVRGAIAANGGAEFGMEFDTFWHDYHIVIFSGGFSANMAFQMPGSPMLSGQLVIHYDVLGGCFSGDVGANIEF